MAMQTSNAILEIRRQAVSSGFAPFSSDFEVLMHSRRRHVVRSQNTIVMAILEACRTPTVQHWIMVKARLGYDTFWKHMNSLITLGMMNTLNDGHRTLYSVNEKGLNFLRELETK